MVAPHLNTQRQSLCCISCIRGACTGCAEVQTVVDVVQRPDSDAPDAFPGLYLSVLPAQPFVGPTTLLLTSQWRSSSDIVRIDLGTGAVQSLRPAGSRGAWGLLTAGQGVPHHVAFCWTGPPWNGGLSEIIPWLNLCMMFLDRSHLPAMPPPHPHAVSLCRRRVHELAGILAVQDGWLQHTALQTSRRSCRWHAWTKSVAPAAPGILSGSQSPAHCLSQWPRRYSPWHSRLSRHVQHSKLHRAAVSVAHITGKLFSNATALPVHLSVPSSACGASGCRSS